mgnify:CR=1 FL=1
MSRVSLVCLSQPSAETGCFTAEQLVAYAARVSNPTNQNNTKTAGKLVRYLIRENHWSPLEMVHLTMEITTTRDISRQIIRHRSFSFQEFSQRYAESERFSTRMARLQDPKNRQNSIDDISEETRQKYEALMENHFRDAMALYQTMLDEGIAKECARFVLPLATPTRLYMSGSCRSWIHYIQLRSANGTQKEHMEIAEACKKIFAEQFPTVAEALEWI